MDTLIDHMVKSGSGLVFHKAENCFCRWVQSWFVIVVGIISAIGLTFTFATGFGVFNVIYTGIKIIMIIAGPFRVVLTLLVCWFKVICLCGFQNYLCCQIQCDSYFAAGFEKVCYSASHFSRVQIVCLPLLFLLPDRKELCSACWLRLTFIFGIHLLYRPI